MGRETRGGLLRSLGARPSNGAWKDGEGVQRGDHTFQENDLCSRMKNQHAWACPIAPHFRSTVRVITNR